MNEQILRDHYAKRGFSIQEADEAVASVRELQAWLEARQQSLEHATRDQIRAYIKVLINDQRNTLGTLLALARYFYLTGQTDLYVYFTSLLGGLGVIDSIRDRLGTLIQPSEAQALIDAVAHPPLGADPVDFPAFTRALMERLEQNLPRETVLSALAGNHHQIPAEAFEEDIALYRSSGSIDAFLRAMYTRQLETLQRHCDTGTVWFEQIITQEVVDYVAQHQEILSAVRDGDTLYHTKIPYDPARYLAASDPTEKRYYACHCPFVREAILKGESDISSDWCYCSAGFAKYPYEVVLGRELRVELLQSALRGDPVCRFAIHLPTDESE
ncbi:MAG: hypothetical protein VB061_10145 [Christensenella sp.]|nr:hypothetical protein [Christensenella sp.]